MDPIALLTTLIADAPRAILSGVALGAIYALIAQGFYVTHTTTNTLNFAQGDFLMIGAMLSYSLLIVGVGTLLPALTQIVPAGVALILTFLIVMAIQAVMGIVIERIAIRPLRHLLSVGWILSTVGVSIILQNTAEILWGRESRAVPSIFGTSPIFIAGAGIRPQEIFTIIVSLGAMVALLLLLKRSIFGKMLSAVALNPGAAGLMGIDVRRMTVASYVISSMLAGLAGVLIAPTTFAFPVMGVLLGLKAFAAAIIGGLENPVGILIAGLGIGIIEQFIQSFNPSLRDAVTFFILILILAWRPQGLFERVSVEKV